MKLITIQHASVLNLLKNNNTYYADFLRILDNKSNLVEPYRLIMSHYNYSSVPIFCNVLNRRAEFYGANTENAVIIELDVPDDLVKIQSYYDWVDVIYFMEFPNELDGMNIDKFAKDVLEGMNVDDDRRAIQATIPYIKPEWLVGSYKLTSKFTDLHYGSGGRNILTENSYK